MVEKGSLAPDFTLPSDSRGEITLSSFQGRRVVLCFYPKDDTSGCTAQACELRDALPRFEGVNAVVLGVSPDSVASHRKFREKYGLNYLLLSDEDHAVAEAYGVWVKKSMYGKKYVGVERSTFLIGEDGRVLEAWRNVKPTGHAELVERALRA